MWIGTVTATIGSGTITLVPGSGAGLNNEIIAKFTATGVNANTKWTASSDSQHILHYQRHDSDLPGLNYPKQQRVLYRLRPIAGCRFGWRQHWFYLYIHPQSNEITYNTSLSNATAYTPVSTIVSDPFNAIGAEIYASTPANGSLELAIGSSGTPTGQLYVSGTMPTTYVGATDTGLGLQNHAVVVAGRYAYVASASGNDVVIFDVTNPANPIWVGSVSTNINDPTGMFIEGRYAYVSSYTNNEMVIFDISNPASPAYVSEISTGLNGPNAIMVSGNYAYVTSFTNGQLVIYNISNPAYPTYVSSIGGAYSAAATQSYIQGHYAYIASYTGSDLAIIDISNPADPIYMGQVTALHATTVFVQGNYAYVAGRGAGNNGLMIFDVANPAAPTLVGQTGPSYIYSINTATSVFVQGRYAYVTSPYYNGLTAWDISNPANPTFVGEVTAGLGSPQYVWIDGRYAYVTNFSAADGLVIFDLGGEYAQQLQTGSTETGTLQVDGYAQVTGDEDVQGSVNVGANVLVNGNIGSNGLSITGLAAPSYPIITPTGTTGSTSYSYAVGAANTANQSPLSAPTTTTTGNATLTTTNLNSITWTAVPGATNYNIYRTFTGNGASPATTGQIGTIASASLVPLTPTNMPTATGSANNYSYAFNLSTPPAFTVGQVVTLAGFSVSSGAINGSFEVTAVTSTSVTIFSTAAVPAVITADGTISGTTGFDDSGIAISSAIIPTSGTEAFNVQNSSGNVVLGANVATGQVSLGETSNPLSAPTGLSATTAQTGGNFPASTTYYYKVTALDSAGGESLPSAELSKATVAGTATNTITLAWTPVAGATAYRVYRGTSPKAENVYYVTTGTIVATTTTTTYSTVAQDVNFTDTGLSSVLATIDSGTPPTTSTAVLSANINPNPSFVNKWQASGAGITSLTVTPYNVGDILVLTTDTTTAADYVKSISGGGVSVWTTVGSNPIQGGTKEVEMWMGTVTSTGSGVSAINVTYNAAAGANEITATEFTASGVNANTNWITASEASTYYTTSGTTVTYPALSTQTSNELYIGYGQSPGAGSAGASAGFTYVSTLQSNELAYNTNLAYATAYTPTSTIVSDPFNSVAALFYANTPSSSSLQLAIGGDGTPTGQVYIGGNVPSTYIGATGANLYNARGVYVSGRYAYVASATGNNIVIFDVSNPANPTIIGTTPSTNLNDPQSVYVSGRYAYVASYVNSEMVIFDISNPTNPTYVGAIGTDLNNPQDVVVSGRYAYVTSFSNSLFVIYDISNPAAPTFVSATNSGGLNAPYYVYVQGHYAYITNWGTNALMIYDISNPTTPVWDGWGPVTSPFGIYVQGRYAYVSTNNSGINNQLLIFDVSNPVSPPLVGQISTGLSGGGTSSVSVSGHYAYVTNSGNNSLVTFDVSNPTSPTYVDQVSAGLNNPQSLFVSGRYAYVANWSGSDSNGLVIYDLGGEYTSSLQAGGAEVGSLQVDGNAQVAGDENVQGSLSVSANALINGNIGTNGLIINGLSTPPAPTVTPTGGSGTTTYSYAVSAFNSSSQSPLSAVTTTTTGYATLGGSYSNLITWSPVPGATGYNIYRTYTASANPNTTGYINSEYGSVLSYSDNNATAPYTATIPTSGTEAFNVQNASGDVVLGANVATGQISLNETLNPLSVLTGLSVYNFGSAAGDSLGTNTYYYKVTAIDSTGGESLPSAEVSHTFASGATNYVTLSWTPVAGATAYRVYRGTAAGAENVYYVTTGTIVSTPYTTTYTTTAPLVNFLDTGATTNGSGTPPSTSSAILSANINPSPSYVNKWLNSGTSISTLADSPLNIGDVLVLTTDTTTGSDYVTGISGGGVSSWALVGTNPIQGGTKEVEMWMGTVTAVGSSTITVTYHAAAGANEITATEFTASGVNANTKWTATSEASTYYTTSGTTVTYPALTAQTSNELYIGYGQSPGAGSAGASTGFTYISTLGSNMLAYDTSLTYATAYTPTSTIVSDPFNTVAALLYASTSSNSSLQLAIGGSGTPTGQVYVSGNVPATSLGMTTVKLSGPVSTFVSGRYAYVVSNGTNNLQIFDVSNPANPTFVGQTLPTSSGYDYLSGAFAVYVQGRYAYVLSSTNNELVIYDVSNPANPTYVGEVGTNLSTPQGIYVSGRYAYVTDNIASGELVIFDISNPVSPVYVGETGTDQDFPQTVYVQGEYAYVGGSGTGNFIIDNISNPASPVMVGVTNTGLNAVYSVYVSGRYAYLVNNISNQLVIEDVSNPAAPIPVGSTSANLLSPYAVSVQGRYAYVASQNNNELVAFDVSNPSNPVYVGEVGSNLNGPRTVFVSGRYAYVGSQTNNALVTFDLGGTYTQQLQAGGAEVGTLQVDNNAQVAGDESLQGGLTVGTNAQISGNLSVSGAANLGSVVTITGGPLTTPSAPTVTATGGSGTNYQYEIAAINANGQTTAASAANVAVSGPASLTATAYMTVSWPAVTGAYGYNVYRVTGGGTTGLIGVTQGNGVNTFFYDTGYVANGAVPPATSSIANSFVVQNATGGQLLSVNNTSNLVQIGQSGTLTATLTLNSSASTGSAYVGLQSGAMTTGSYTIVLPTAAPAGNGYCLVSGSAGPTVSTSWGNCYATHQKVITLTPEYAGAVLYGTGGSNTGTMTSGYTTTGYTNKENYYEWTTTQTTAQNYDVVVSIPVPSDFASWNGANPINVDLMGNPVLNDTIAITMYDTSNTVATNWNACTLTTSTTWARSTACAVSGGTWTPNSTIDFMVNMQAAASGGTIYLGDITLSYNSTY